MKLLKRMLVTFKIRGENNCHQLLPRSNGFPFLLLTLSARKSLTLLPVSIQ